MSRTAIDATRFTATGPYAYSKSSTSTNASSRWPGSKVRSSQTSQSATGGEQQETPKQKVERLRAQARAARFAKSSPFDRLLQKGRLWADRAHRVAVFSLIAASGMFNLYGLFYSPLCFLQFLKNLASLPLVNYID